MPATKFTATSPITGQVYHRSSLRGQYTHAAIFYVPTAVIVADLTRNIADDMMYYERYILIAEHLEAGTTPSAGSPLLAREAGTSLAQQRAGVRTIWDTAVFYVRESDATPPGTKWHRVVNAATYREYAATMANGIAKARQAIVDAQVLESYQESATFHHSHALAVKASRATVRPGCIHHIVDAAIVPSKARRTSGKDS